ncbi:hypothetical protein PTSG_10256 [Salpingoeca rosetta]|uniref:Uncharacterized protein n=1 Tax=Salpingoeca rosetta (strain ATCC 50818 / BSB-021) TaxID=946362 RepID=F2UQS0_SALR5|nr:uncharacterized protein PTSG_10256 [Salpingoeca rosetta]EGD79975.1 hypothetical protein PTSG_10256 [Salpingoeca rosetta]|eukprot:XP_004988596.1 hypothetical protein PTSG_10256 [Salpingoeca rosetta]
MYGGVNASRASSRQQQQLGSSSDVSLQGAQQRQSLEGEMERLKVTQRSLAQRIEERRRQVLAQELQNNRAMAHLQEQKQSIATLQAQIDAQSKLVSACTACLHRMDQIEIEGLMLAEQIQSKIERRVVRSSKTTRTTRKRNKKK